MRLKVFRSLHYRDASKPCWCERSISPSPLGSIDHPAFKMSGYCNTTIYMAYDVGCILITDFHPPGMFSSNPFLVQHVGLSSSINTFKPCNARKRSKLIHISRIYSICRAAILQSPVICHHYSKFRRMITATLIIPSILIKGSVYLHHSLFLGICAPSTPDENIDIFNSDIMF